MEKNPKHFLTPFDELTTSRQLQTIKLLLPYLPTNGQRMLGIFIRLNELQNAIHLFRGFPVSPSSDSLSPSRILSDLSPYLSEEESQQMAQVNQLLQMMELFQNMPTDNPAGFSPDLLMGMLNPEQKEMFQTYDAMFSDTMNQMDFTTSKEVLHMNEWMNHPKMQNMDPIKLELIKMAAAQTAGKSGKDLAPILFALITNAGKHNIQFSPEEITLILDLLKEGKSDAEKAQIDRTVNMAASMLKKKA